MISEKPLCLYKYQSIDTMIKHDSGREIPRSIQSLFDSEALFSSRTQFNDLFDSKIDLTPTSPQEIKKLIQHVDKDSFEFLSSLINKGKFTSNGLQFFQNLKAKFEELVDDYMFYCLSGHGNSNLMWAHYASSHQGFCIEFKSEQINADKVIYEKNIPSIDVLDFLKITHIPTDEKDNILGQKVWKSLTTKLIEWEYEEEFRFLASDEMKTRMKKIDSSKAIFKYSPDDIESIIFGCRMKDDLKDLIIENMPAGTKFKQAEERKSHIEVVKYKK